MRLENVLHGSGTCISFEFWSIIAVSIQAKRSFCLEWSKRCYPYSRAKNLVPISKQWITKEYQGLQNTNYSLYSYDSHCSFRGESSLQIYEFQISL